MMTLIVLFMVFTAHHDTIEYRTIHDHKLPKGFDKYRVFFISDIHRRKINPNTLNRIKGEIDLVVIGGDLTEKGVPLERTRENLKKLKQFGTPIYFVWGNNDYEVFPDILNKMLIEEDVIILKDSRTKITKNNDTMHVVGFDYHQERENRLDIDWQHIEDEYCLLLTHVPQDFYELDFTIQKKIHTVLAGHTHGGQIRLFGLGFYQKGGFHTFQQTNIFISEGYGYTFLPFRLQTKAECHVLTFENI